MIIRGFFPKSDEVYECAAAFALELRREFKQELKKPPGHRRFEKVRKMMRARWDIRSFEVTEDGLITGDDDFSMFARRLLSSFSKGSLTKCIWTYDRRTLELLGQLLRGDL